MKPHIQRWFVSTWYWRDEWVCFYPDEPFSCDRRGYGKTPLEAYQSWEQKLKQRLEGLLALQNCPPMGSEKEYVPGRALSQVLGESSPPPNAISETPPPPVAMTDGLHRRVRKILDTFPLLGCKRNR